MVKSEKEIAFLMESAKLNLKALEHIFDFLKEGVFETEVRDEYQKFILKNGAEGVAFPAIIGFGENTAIPHHVPKERKLQIGDAVTLDVGLMLNGYASDVTRSFFFHKEGDLTFTKLVREAHRRALEVCKPGVDFGELGKMCDDYFKENGVFAFRKHSLGHGIGKKVHEEPKVTSEDRILRPGMCITIEPGLYEEGRFGYRHEDTILITNKGYVNFYESWNRTR